MEERKTKIDNRLEQKIGFDRIRQIISDRCSTSYAVDKVFSENFSTKASQIRKRLLLTDEMRLIMMFEDGFPSAGFIDCIDFLKPLESTSSAIDLVSLRKLRTMLDTLRKVTSFFSFSMLPPGKPKLKDAMLDIWASSVGLHMVMPSLPRPSTRRLFSILIWRSIFSWPMSN